jgi:hypothetical protein
MKTGQSGKALSGAANGPDLVAFKQRLKIIEISGAVVGGSGLRLLAVYASLWPVEMGGAGSTSAN